MSASVASRPPWQEPKLLSMSPRAPVTTVTLAVPGEIALTPCPASAPRDRWRACVSRTRLGEVPGVETRPVSSTVLEHGRAWRRRPTRLRDSPVVHAEPESASRLSAPSSPHAVGVVEGVARLGQRHKQASARRAARPPFRWRAHRRQRSARSGRCAAPPRRCTFAQQRSASYQLMADQARQPGAT